MLVIAVSATKNYLYAFSQCVRAISAAANHHVEAHFVFATDESQEAEEASAMAASHLPEGWTVTTLRLPIADDTSTNYKEEAQLRIARLQGATFEFARKIRADRLWSVESDNIVPADALRTLEWTLDMPTADGSPYYDVAAATYPNGLFLGGFGTPQNQIAEDFLPEERKISTRLKRCLEVCESRLNGVNIPYWSVTQYDTKRPWGRARWMPSDCPGAKFAAVTDVENRQLTLDHEAKRMARLRARVKGCPPDGNIWEVTAKHGWRRRGWMDFAYPGIGKGAVVPSDWCGLGCTLLSKRALALAEFTGYTGGGTQDLFLCWQRWYPAGLRIAAVPHVVCDHIKRRGDKIEHLIAYHEHTGECRGHLRVRSQPWVPV